MEKKKIIYSVLATVLLVLLLCIPFISHAPSPKTEYSIVALGDSMLGQVRNEGGIIGILEGKIQETIFNGALGGTQLSNIKPSEGLYHEKNCLSLWGLTEAICYEDFGAQHTFYSKENGTEYFQETIGELEKIDFDKVEIVLIGHGTNDYNYGIPLENPNDPYDRYTYAGALRSSLKLLQKSYPQLRIILVTPTYCWFPMWDEDCETWMPVGATLLDYISLEKEIAKEFDVEIIDNYQLFSHESFEDCIRYTMDGLHPNDLGRELIAEAIAAYLGEQE